jgi:hypothetical protein
MRRSATASAPTRPVSTRWRTETVPGDVTPHYFATSADLDEWLHENEDTSPGIWVVAAKKGSPWRPSP